ncbi:MAG: glycosyltransferase family 4 protein [Candidatus Aureabacteria bacterium]|nr:glycosyltransferase family 4 protein [Candidatus Auribacterota bacterium]
MKEKGILQVAIILISHNVGGTQKRMLNLFSYLSENGRHRYMLFINQALYRECVKRGYVTERKNIRVLFKRKIFRCIDKMVTDIPLLRSGRGKAVRKGFNVFRLFIQKFALFLEKRQYADTVFDIAHFALAGDFDSVVTYKKLVMECVASNIEETHWKDGTFREMIRRADRVNILSADIKRKLEKLTGVKDDEKYQAAPCSFTDYSGCRVGRKELCIVFSGRMEDVKNPFLFLEALKLLKEKTSLFFQAFMLGHGALEEDVDKKIGLYGLADLVKRMEHPSPQEILSRSLIYVSLQEANNYPSQALLEAMACGCAVIATDVGETSLLVGKEEGFLVPFDKEVIAEKMLWLIQHSAEAEKMGLAAREKVIREHTAERYARFVEKMYDDALL